MLSSSVEGGSSRKRPLTETTSSGLPQDHKFNFVPILRPGQKLFDTDANHAQGIPPPAQPIQFSVAALTHRIQKRFAQQFASSVSPAEVRASTASYASPVSSSIAQSEYIYHHTNALKWLSYLHATFNTLLSLLLVYIVLTTLITLRQDYQIKARDYTSNAIYTVATCAHDYRINRCEPATRVPAMESKCNAWKACMEKDPTSISSGKVFAELVAEIVNSFVEPISYKTLIFVIIFCISAWTLSFLASNMYHRKYPQVKGRLES